MIGIQEPVATIRKTVKIILFHLAKLLNKLSAGKVTADHVTAISLLGHVLVAIVIAARHPVWGAGLLVIFGLMDGIDGELARLQKKPSKKGMLYDSISDRIKEIMLYVGAAYFFVSIDLPLVAIWSVAALGTSMLVSYLNAWGEALINNKDPGPTNKRFRQGLMSYDVRMFLFAAGLISALLPEIILLITILSAITAFGRFRFILKRM